LQVFGQAKAAWANEQSADGHVGYSLLQLTFQIKNRTYDNFFYSEMSSSVLNIPIEQSDPLLE
jgi:hypothetical protein